MTNKMNLIFEPADLEQASPATVSRCGMIYMEPRLLGWTAFRDSYLAKLGKTLLTEQMELIEELIEWLVVPCFKFIRHNCKLFVDTSEIHLFYVRCFIIYLIIIIIKYFFQSFTRLFTCMLVEEQQVSTVWLQCIFVFCLAWGLGSTMNSDGRQQFDVFYRKLLYGENKTYPKPKLFKLTKNQLFPDRCNVFDWVYDKKNNGSWIAWVDTVEKIQQIPSTAKVIFCLSLIEVFTKNCFLIIHFRCQNL